MVIMTSLGFRNGYLRLSKTHPWYDVLMDVKPDNPPDWDQIEYATGIPVPDSMRRRSADPEWRQEAAWYEWLGSRVGVHGGWTYSKLVTDHAYWDEWIGDGDGIPLGLWFGFDTGHYGDAPDLEWLKQNAPEQHAIWGRISMISEGHVWTADDVALELEAAADEINAASILAEVDL